ncbi:MAG: DUF1858 domain-containing protein [Clostridia bacterium]
MTNKIEITKDMKIVDVVSAKRATVPVFGQHGMGCIGCLAANSETVEQAAAVHGLDLNELLEALNRA